jgi:hypothetical protein
MELGHISVDTAPEMELMPIPLTPTRLRSTPFVAIALAVTVLLSATPMARAVTTTASVADPLAAQPSVTLNWAPPASNGGAVITGYRVYRGSTSGTETIYAFLGVVTSFTDTAVTNGVTYFYQVTAVNLVGEGARSGERAATPGAVATVPGAPLIVSTTPGNGWVALDWSPPASDGGSAITSYLVIVSPGGATCATTGTPSCTIGGLTNGTPYSFTVTATNSVGTGPASNPSFATPVAPTPATPPTAHITTLAMFRNTTAVALSWSATAGSAAVANYDVRFRTAPWNGSFGAYYDWLGSDPARSASLNGAAGNTYCFGVRARDVNGLLSTWTADTCTAIPLDDRSFVRSSSWSSGTLSLFYKSTWARSYTSGAKLTRTGVVARRISLIATTCPTCGKVRVYWGATLLRTISLYSSTTINKRIIGVTTFTSARSGTLTLRVYGSGRKVILDGVAIARN